MLEDPGMRVEVALAQNLWGALLAHSHQSPPGEHGSPQVCRHHGAPHLPSVDRHAVPISQGVLCLLGWLVDILECVLGMPGCE